MNYIKINGIWKPISKGFKKENGEWIELNNASSPFLGETIIKNYVDYSSPGMASSSFLAINSLSDLQKANGYTGSIITNSGVTESSEVPPNTSFTKSLYFNGSSFLTLNNYNFGANNFTIEWWEKSTNSSSGTRFMSTYGTSGGTEAGMMIGWWCTAHRMPEIKWTSYNSYSSWNVIGHGSSAGNVDTSGWHHMAYVRNGSNLYVIKDGALINTITVSTYAMGYNGSLPMCFGRRGSNSANSTCFSGYLCGIRLSNTALYTQFGTYEERVEPDLSLKYKYGGSKGLSISSLPLGTLIRVADSDGGDGVANYEIADINNLVPGGVVLVRKNVYSDSAFGLTTAYPNDTLDNLIKTTIYNKMPHKLQDKMMDVSFNLYGSGDITRKMFALTYTMAGFGANNDTTEGKALQLYTSNTSRKKTLNGSAAGWWLSSRKDASYSCSVGARGTAGSSSPSNSRGVVPAFAIPQSVMLEDSANEDGSYNIMMEAEGGSAPISELPLGTLINVSTDGGADLPYYEIADKDNLVNGGVVLVRKYVYSKPEFVSSTTYPNHSLDSLIKTDIYNKMPQKLRDKMMDVTFNLYGSGDITRKMFALTWTMVGFGDNRGVTEGKALQLYTSNDSRVKKFNGSATYWWLSSQYSSRYVRCVSMSGSDYDLEPSLSAGVVPAFVIPSKTPYDPTPNMYGAYYLSL